MQVDKLLIVAQRLNVCYAVLGQIYDPDFVQVFERAQVLNRILTEIDDHHIDAFWKCLNIGDGLSGQDYAEDDIGWEL